MGKSFLDSGPSLLRDICSNCHTLRLQCLLPLCNAPLIAWTLESLAASNVKNTFIIIREGAQELQEWLEYAMSLYSL